MKKKIGAFLVAFTLLFTTVCCGIGTVFATGETLPQRGGTLLVTGRGGVNASPKQVITEALAAEGTGTYEISGWVRLKSQPASAVTAKFVIQLTNDSKKNWWPSAQLENINDTEWHYVTGTPTVNWTGTLTDAFLYIQTTGYSGDVEFDGFCVRKGAGENLIQDAECDITGLSPASAWTKNGVCTITNPYTPTYGVGTLLVTGRTGSSARDAGPMQGVATKLSGTKNGTYTISAWVRLKEMPEAPVRALVCLYVQGKSIYSATTVISDTEWHFISTSTSVAWDNTVTPTDANTYLYTSTRLDSDGSTAYTGDVEWDAFCLRKTGGFNLIDDAECDIGTLASSAWTTKNTCTIVNPLYTPMYGGGTLLVTGRTHQDAGPRQNIAAKLTAEGEGSYTLSAWVRLKNTPASAVSVLAILYVDGKFFSQTISVSDTEWHLIQTTVNVNWTNALTDDNEKTYFYTSTRTNYTGDVEWDAFCLRKTGGLNLFDDAECDISTLASSAWMRKNTCTIINPLTARPGNLPAVGGGSLLMTSRAHRASGFSQDITDALNANGTGDYYISGHFRLRDVLGDVAERGVKVQLGICVTDTSAHWYTGSSLTVYDDEWYFFEETRNLNWTGSVQSAYVFIHTLYATGSGTMDELRYPGNMEWDAISLNTKFGTGSETFGANLLVNPDLDIDRFGATPGWTTNQTLIMTNTVTLEPDFTMSEGSGGAHIYAAGYVPATDSNIVYSGRWTDMGDGSVRNSFEGYAEIRFTGTCLYVLSPASGGAYVSVDGSAPVKVTLSGGLCLASGLAAGEHTVVIYSAAQCALPRFAGFIVDENAQTLRISQDKIIEFIGDSITEGYVHPTDVGDYSANSYMNSYAYRTGAQLRTAYDAVYNTVAFGAIGITRSGADPLYMPERYFKEREYVASTDGSTASSARAAVGAWDTSVYIPDYVVINLGTNDEPAASDVFTAAYVAFLTDLRTAYPDAMIFCMTPFNGTKAAEVRNAVTNFEDEKVVLIDSATWGIPAGSDNLHPAAATHETIASNLFEELKPYFARFTGASLTLKNDLKINFTAKASIVPEGGESYAIFTMNGTETRVNATTVGDDLVFSFDNIAPHYMNDTIRAVIHVEGEGVDFAAEEIEYSVASYCYRMLAKEESSPALKKLIVDMLFYGAEGQKYMGYETDHLVTENLTEAQIALGTTEEIELTGVTAQEALPNAAAKWYSAGLNLKDSITMRFTFTLTDGSIDPATLNVKITDAEDNMLAVVTSLTGSDGRWTASYKGLHAGQMSKTVKVTVCQGDTAISKTLIYSIESYAKNKENDPEVGDLVKAMMKYGKSASAYVG